MKWIIPIALVAALASCGEKPKDQKVELKEKHRSLIRAHIDLQEEVKSKDAFLEHFRGKLAQMTARHQNTSLKADNPETHNASIDQYLQGINQFMELNRYELSQLRDSLMREKKQGVDLRAELGMAEKLEGTYLFALEDAERTIDDMVAALDGEIALANGLLAKLDMAEAQVLATENTLNEVRLAYGTRQELKRQGFVQRKGGVFGFGGALVSNTPQEASYSTLDKRLTTSIPFPADRCKLVSHHPTESYEWMREDGQSILFIKDPDAFWSSSSTLTTILL